jgi:hypothetical protein
MGQLARLPTRVPLPDVAVGDGDHVGAGRHDRALRDPVNYLGAGTFAELSSRWLYSSGARDACAVRGGARHAGKSVMANILPL